MWSLNATRRHLEGNARKIAAAKYAIELEREARERQGTRTDLTSASNDANVEFGRSREIAAEKFNESRATVERAVKVVKDGTPETITPATTGPQVHQTMGPPMPTEQHQQPARQAESEPIRDQYGREWDALYGFEKPPGETAAAFQRSNEAARASDTPSALSRSSATTASAADSKSIFSDMPDIGAAFTPALNFFSSLFG